MKPLILLDAGHGNLLDNKYQTSGKRSPVYGDYQLFEGEFNRAVIIRIAEGLAKLRIPYNFVFDFNKDTRLSTRVKNANKLSVNRSTFLISVHANAGGGNGFEAWTYTGQSKSDLFADYFYEEFKIEYPNKNIRTDTRDGDKDKEAKFTILSGQQYAVLTENFFMDNRYECLEILSCPTHRQRIANYHIKAIQKIYKQL